MKDFVGLMCLAIFAMLCAGRTPAQEISASLRGTVVDASGRDRVGGEDYRNPRGNGFAADSEE